MMEVLLEAILEMFLEILLEMFLEILLEMFLENLLEMFLEMFWKILQVQPAHSLALVSRISLHRGRRVAQRQTEAAHEERGRQQSRPNPDSRKEITARHFYF